MIDCAHFDGQSNQSHETIDVFFLTYQRSVMIDENVSSTQVIPWVVGTANVYVVYNYRKF